MSRVVACVGVAAFACGCRGSSGGHAQPRVELERAGDAGFAYVQETEVDAGALGAADAGARPSIELVAGVPSGRGDLDGVAGAARIGLVAGMARVGDAIVFADEGNASMRRFDPATSEVTTLARFPQAADGVPSLPAGVAFDGKARVYVVNRSRHVLYALDLASRRLEVVAGQEGVRGHADGVATQAQFDSPTGLAFDGAHTLYATDVGNRRIRRIDLESGSVSTVASGLQQPWGICFAGGALYVTENLGEALFRVDPASGATMVLVGSNRFGYAGPKDGVGRDARLREPRGISCTPQSIFVADRGNAMVRRVDVGTWGVKSLAGHPGWPSFRDGQGEDAMFRDLQSTLAWGDVVYAGDDASLREVTVATGRVRTVAGAGRPTYLEVAALQRGAMLHPSGITVAPAERAAFVGDCGSSTVVRVDLDTRAVTTFLGKPMLHGFLDGWGEEARFGCPTAVARDGHGNLFVGDSENHAVRVVHVADRRVRTMAGSPTRCGNDDGALDVATFCDPSGMAFGGEMLYVADASTSTIRRVDVARGVVTTLAGEPWSRGFADGTGRAARFSSPASIAYTGGMLYVADRENGVVRSVDPGTGAVTTIGPARFRHPRAIAPQAAGVLLVADDASVARLSLSDGAAQRLVPAGAGLRVGASQPSLGQPFGVAAVGGDEALVVDRSESVVARLLY